MKAFSCFIVLLILLAAHGPCWAQEEDSSQPIFIEADAATYNDNTGDSVFTGNVEVIQGALTANSDKMTVYTKDKKPYKIISIGTPVSFVQKQKPGEDDIHGESLRSEYFLDTGLLIMIDKAVVRQGQNTYASDRIEYDKKNAIVKAGQASSSGKRVHITLGPQSE